MRRMFVFLALLMVALLASMPVLAEEGKVLFMEDAKYDTLDNWNLDTTTDGNPDNFSVKDKAICFGPVAFGNLFSGDEDWKDYSVEQTIRMDEYGMYGSIRLLLRMNKLWYGYAISFTDGLYLVHRFDGNWDKSVLLKQGSTPIPVGKAVRLKSRIAGNTMTFWLNGKELCTVSDNDGLYTAGMFGYRFDNSAGRVSDITVREVK